MANSIYTASLSQSQGRTGWSIIFRHPVRSDPATGKPGLRVRRGLGTRDKDEATALRNQLNELINEQRLHIPNARSEAEHRFDHRIVEIFFYGMTAEPLDFSAIREQAIPLPTLDDDYRRVLLIGTTGAGKTTLVRQLIGTDPTKDERFPSTSTAKTTIHDTEIVLDKGPWRAVVTFAPIDEVREHLNECISAAVLSAWRGSSDAEIIRHLLNHVNQRFRFAYVLGSGPIAKIEDFDEEDEDEAQLDVDALADYGEVDLEATNEVLRSAVVELRRIARDQGDQLRQELEASSETDQRVIDELFEEELDNLLRYNEEAHVVTDNLLDEIEKRFDILTVGDLNRGKQGWPLSWQWETTDRESFIKVVSRFSSNWAPLFGRLLTPLVNGIRVAGPFGPSWTDGQQPRLVLLDGEGLGHTPTFTSAIPTSVSRRIEEADAVLLVDNAIQPMQAAPVAATRDIVASGHARKLILVFTHFDEVKGDNLPTMSAKVQHVLASAENVLPMVGEELGPFGERALRQRLDKARFFLESIQTPISPENAAGRRTIKQLESMLHVIDEIVERPQRPEAKAVYDRMNLVLAVKSAAERFQDAWLTRLGRQYKPNVAKEHWTRIKALSRRLAEGWADEYDTLRPIADLRKELIDRIYVFVQNPLKWEETGLEPSDDQKQAAYDSFAESIGRRMLALATRRLKTERTAHWQKAYDQHGRGSTFVRADIIGDEIYLPAAPIPDVTPSPDRNDFLHQVAEEVEQAANEVGTILK